MKRDAFDAIGADLSAAASEKRRHFFPAMLGVGALVLALLMMAGVREDFTLLPMWRQAALLASWVVCGLLFPAVGVGVWFPGRPARIALIAVGVLLPLCGVIGWPLGDAPHPAAPCGMALMILVAGFVGIGALSGAFAQRRAIGSTAWVAAGLTLAALATTSGIGPVDDAMHLTMGHVLPGLVLASVAAALGRWLHRRQRSQR